jgi:hypothetical protein
MIDSTPNVEKNPNKVALIHYTKMKVEEDILGLDE